MSAFNRLKRGLDDAYKHRKKIKGAAQSIGHYINEVKRTATQQQKVRDMDAMTLGGTPVYRRLSISSTGSRTPTSSRTPSSGRKSGLSVLSAPSTRIPLKIVKKGNRRLKGTKHVKVSKLFKAKVKECSSANHVYGYFRLILRLVFLINPILTRPTSTIWLCVLDLLMDLCSVSLMFCMPHPDYGMVRLLTRLHNS